jgi:transcriptional regulator
VNRVEAFEITDPTTINGLISVLGFAHLVTNGPEGLTSTALPLVLDESPGPLGTLRGHLARANPQAALGPSPAECLVIFSGPHAYISPTAYATATGTRKVVPTWNYLEVNVSGHLRIVTDPEWLRANVSELTTIHEADQVDPWSISDAPADFIDSMLKGIVGIEIEITKVQAKAKLSQNRSEDDRDGVIARLLEGSARDREVAHLMASAGRLAGPS